MSIIEALHEAQLVGQIVRIHHCIDGAHVDCFVVKVGVECFLIETFSDTLHLNGFSCLRYADVSEAECPAPYSDFLRKVFELRGLLHEKDPDLNLTSLEEAIKSAQNCGPLVSLHLQDYDKEKENQLTGFSDVAYIGKILSVANGRVKMLCLSPDATWESEPDVFDLKQVYRLDVGGGYEEALLLVSGAATGSAH
jgi:hypothetical protein